MSMIGISRVLEDLQRKVNALDQENAALKDEVQRLRGALTRIWEHPNSEANHHPDECELRNVDPVEQDDEICTCGYWSSSYPELKLMARAALQATESETKA